MFDAVSPQAGVAVWTTFLGSHRLHRLAAASVHVPEWQAVAAAPPAGGDQDAVRRWRGKLLVQPRLQGSGFRGLAVRHRLAPANTDDMLCCLTAAGPLSRHRPLRSQRCLPHGALPWA
jgi:hypothetical protein